MSHNLDELVVNTLTPDLAERINLGHDWRESGFVDDNLIWKLKEVLDWAKVVKVNDGGKDAGVRRARRG